MATSDQDDSLGERGPTAQNEAAAREQRLAALRDLAGERLGARVEAPRQAGDFEAPPTPSARQAQVATAKSPARKGSGRGWVWGVVLAVLVVAVIAVGAIRFGPALAQRNAGQKNLPPVSVLSFTPRYDGNSCFSDAVWSPKGDEIALLGYQNGCEVFDTAGSSPGVINLYSAVTGKLVTQFQLDTLLHQAGIIQQGGQFIQYDNVAWAANGQVLAAPFLLGLMTTGDINPIQYSHAGLLLINILSGHTQVFLYNSTKEADVTGPIVWDVATGKATAHPSLDPLGAAAYQWETNGQLASLAKAPSGAVGNPVGGQTFTIWQPGTVYVVLEPVDPTNPTALKPVPGVYVWSNNFIAWSPDGRYLYAALGAFENLTLPNTPPPSVAQLKQAGFYPLQTTTPHDVALTNLYPQLLQQIPTEIQNDQQGFPEANVAWSSDGRVLAAQPAIASSSSNEHTVTLYDTTTGNIVKKLTHDTQLSGSADGNPALLRWSPDGKRLALADNNFDTLTIWTFNTPIE